MAAGRLVSPFDISLPSELAYYFVAPCRYFGVPKVAAFYHWVYAEARDYRKADSIAADRARLVNASE